MTEVVVSSDKGDVPAVVHWIAREGIIMYVGDGVTFRVGELVDATFTSIDDNDEIACAMTVRIRVKAFHPGVAVVTFFDPLK